MGRRRNTPQTEPSSPSSSPRSSARRHWAALDSQSAFKKSPNGKLPGPQTLDRGADTLVPVKTHQRREGSWAMAPCPRPVGRPTANAVLRLEDTPPVCSAPGSQRQKRLVTRVHVPFDLYFAPLSSFSRDGVSHPLSTSSTPPSNLCEPCVSRLLEPCMPAQGQEGGRGGGGVSAPAGKVPGACGCEAHRPLPSGTRRWGLKYIIQKPPPSPPIDVQPGYYQASKTISKKSLDFLTLDSSEASHIGALHTLSPCSPCPITHTAMPPSHHHHHHRANSRHTGQAVPLVPRRTQTRTGPRSRTSPSAGGYRTASPSATTVGSSSSF